MKWLIYKKYGIGGTFILICLIIFLVGVIPNGYKILERNISNNYVLTTATISDIYINEITATRVRHDVYVSFDVNGVEYKTLLDTYVEGMKIGDKIEIFYNITNPQKVTLKWNQAMQLVLFSGISIIFGIIGVVCINNRQKNRLNRTGETILTK